MLPQWTWEWRQWRGTPHSPKLQHCWNLTIRLFCFIPRTLIVGGSYPSAEKQSVYFTAPANWAIDIQSESFRCLLKDIRFISYTYHTNISVGKGRPIIAFGFNYCFVFLRRLSIHINGWYTINPNQTKIPELEPHHQMQFSVMLKTLVLFESEIGLWQVLSLRAWVDLGVMPMKWYSTFPKGLELKLHKRWTHFFQWFLPLSNGY